MISPDLLAAKICAVGFCCTRCGSCCRAESDEPVLVMVGPDEIRAIISRYGYSWEDIAAPYPETIHGIHGEKYTFGWVIRRACDHCEFLHADQCKIYAARPLICRTFPFMLDREDLVVSRCPGVGRAISKKDAREIADALIDRCLAEKYERDKIQQHLKNVTLPKGTFVVIDTEGMKYL